MFRQTSVSPAFPRRLLAGLASLALAGLAGCGQKGPLTLPPPVQAASQAAR